VTDHRALAAAQTTTIRGDVDANAEQHLRLIHVAAEQGARVLVFPELSLTGYELQLADELAFSRDDPRLAPLVEAASSCSMSLVVGAPVRLASGLHIGALIVCPDRTVDIYTKRHLGPFPAGASRDGVVPPAEATVFEPGDRDPLVHLGDHLAAVAVCADTNRPSHPRRAAGRGASTYLASMFVIPSELVAETARLQACAARHAMTVVMANHGGPTGGLASAGASAIWSADGELLARLETIGQGVAVAIECDTGWSARAVMLGGG
jgi:predicted amidohydrolase